MDAFNLPLQLGYYQHYHRHPTNVLLHIVCIPQILSSALVMIYPIPYLQAFIILSYSLYYIRLNVVAGLISTVYLFCVGAICKYYLFINFDQSSVILYALLIHLVCWTIQFYGHFKYENNKPAVFDNLIQPLVLAPYFVVFEILWYFGYCLELKKSVLKSSKKNASTASKSEFDVFGKTVIISGASQGLGLELATKIHKLGGNIILLARSEDKLKKIIDSFNKQEGKLNDQFNYYYNVDLSKSEQVEKFQQWLTNKKLIPDIIICCAGSATPKMFTDLTIDELDKGIDLNYKTCLYLLHYMIPLMVKERKDYKRNIVIVSSSVAFYSFAGYSQYAPLKSSLKSLGDSIRQELKYYDIKVNTIFPGNFASEGYHEENLTKPEVTANIEGSSKPISVDECSNIIIKSLKNGDIYIHTDWTGWMLNSFSLGFGPRSNWYLIPVEIVVGIIGLVFARLVDLHHERLVVHAVKNSKAG